MAGPRPAGPGHRLQNRPASLPLRPGRLRAPGGGGRSHRLHDAPPWSERLRAAGAAGGRRPRGKCPSSARVNYSERMKEKKKKNQGEAGTPASRAGPGVAWSSRMTAPSRKQAFVSLTAAPRKHWLRCALRLVSVCFLLKEKPPTSNDNMTTPTARTLERERPLGPPGWTGLRPVVGTGRFVQKRGGHQPGGFPGSVGEGNPHQIAFFGDLEVPRAWGEGRGVPAGGESRPQLFGRFPRVVSPRSHHQGLRAAVGTG